MDAFETISLESTECDICHQDTGEELISCVLNDRYLRESENLKSSCSGNVAKAHTNCLKKWESVIRTSFKPLGHQVKRTWKDRLKGFVNTAQDRGDLIETWAPVINKQICVSGELTNTKRTGCQDASFLTNETYRVESLYQDENRTRGRKVRIKSIEIEDDDDIESSKICNTSTVSTHEEPANSSKTKAKQSREHLLGLDIQELRKLVSGLQAEINKVSTDLVNQLQNRDTLIQQGDTMRVTVGQLITLQTNVKHTSTLSISAGATRIPQAGSMAL